MRLPCAGDLPPGARRQNGFQQPYSWRQWASISIVAFDGVIFGAVLTPNLPHPHGVWLTCLFYSAWLALSALGLLVMSIDPCDPLILKGCVQSEDESLRYCQYCQSLVGEKSKHCWSCRKCVANFDHHCPWVNNCIGEKNYRIFLALILLVLVVLGTMSAGACIVAVDAGGFALAVLIITLLFNVPVLVLDAGLVSLHGFLCWQGITTYQLYVQYWRPRPKGCDVDARALANMGSPRRASGGAFSSEGTPEGASTVVAVGRPVSFSGAAASSSALAAPPPRLSPPAGGEAHAAGLGISAADPSVHQSFDVLGRRSQQSRLSASETE
eukprot:TRINITY_DN63823_c0_g1_i1.p1 TRINITY_DN63823_c0_g1~~TRINITY_DN63823_c0_g1_i1.p1  ORF type:complete len:326 (+),score=34.35 TRINITY_DN63823_c0_g1_i1:38-1015(+)